MISKSKYLTPKLLDLGSHADQRGSLYFGEIKKNWDFDIKRIYFSAEFKDGTLRGCHAHKNLDQVIICVNGSLKVLTDNGIGEKQEFILNIGKALRLYSPVWREIISLSDDSIFVVLASQIYMEEDYLRDYDEFVQYAKTQI